MATTLRPQFFQRVSGRRLGDPGASLLLIAPGDSVPVDPDAAPSRGEDGQRVGDGTSHGDCALRCDLADGGRKAVAGPSRNGRELRDRDLHACADRSPTAGGSVPPERSSAAAAEPDRRRRAQRWGERSTLSGRTYLSVSAALSCTSRRASIGETDIALDQARR